MRKLRGPANGPPWLPSLLGQIERLPSRAMSTAAVSELPDPADYAFTWIFVTDESGGAVPAFSDGTNWRRSTDRAIVS